MSRSARSRVRPATPPPTDVDVVLAKMYAGGTVTRAEAEMVVRSVVRTCKGRKKPDVEAQYAELRKRAGVAGGEAEGQSIAALDAVLREGCGADFNDVICAFPFDGADHLEPCAKCRQPISFRSPVFPVKG